MARKYISLDVEASGAVPGMYSMLSVGACVVGDTSRRFYRELRPISQMFDYAAMKVASLGLTCIDTKNPEFNPAHENFNPKKVLQRLVEKGIRPHAAMYDLQCWVESQSVRGGFEPVLLTDVQPFDGNFIMWYFAKHDLPNPFGYKGVNIDVLYRGITGRMDANLRDLEVIDDRTTPHNALEDAIFQAKLAEKVFSMMKTV